MVHGIRARLGFRLWDYWLCSGYVFSVIRVVKA